MRERRENSAKGLTSTSNNDDGKLAGGPGTKPTQKEDNTRQHLRKGNTEEVVDGVDLAAGLDPSKDASVLALLSATRTEEPPTPRDLACAIEQERDSIKSADAARDLARLRPIVLTLNRCIDEAWRGITTRLRTVDWANATVRGVHERITACDGDEDLRDVCYVTGACLEAVDYYATESEPHRPRNAEWDRVFRNASLDSLMASLAVVLNRTVTISRHPPCRGTRGRSGSVCGTWAWARTWPAPSPQNLPAPSRTWCIGRGRTRESCR